MGVTVPLNQLIYDGVLAPGAWAWAGMPDVDLSYLSLVTFIGVIAASVQFLEMVLERYLPAHPRLLRRVPAAADRPLRHSRRQPVHGRAQLRPRGGAVYGIGSGTGFALAVVMLGAIRTRLAYADLPAGLRGLGIAFVLAGMMSLGFSSFAQMAAQ